MLKKTLFFLPFALLACAQNYGKESQKPTDVYISSVTSLVPEERAQRDLKTRDDVKALFYKPDSWLEAEFDGRKFIFCANSWIYCSCPKMAVHGWVFRTDNGHPGKYDRWERVFAVRVNGAPKLKLSVDPKTGIFSVKGSVYSKPEKALLTFDLSATEL